MRGYHCFCSPTIQFSLEERAAGGRIEKAAEIGNWQAAGCQIWPEIDFLMMV